MTETFPVPANEQQRLRALEDYDILDSLPEQAYDDIAKLAAYICGVDKAMVAFIDADRKWHKAKYNVIPDEMPRSFVICSLTVMSQEPLVISDTLLDERVKNIGIVTQPPHLRFYAGIPLVDDDGMVLGTLCAVDTQPKQIDAAQTEALVTLGNQIMQLLRLRKSLKVLELREKQLHESRQRLNGANHELRRLSITDELTSLNNRRALNEALQRYTRQATEQQTPLSILVIDIDHFKRLNDRRGHVFGDKVLMQVADMIQQRGRQADFCARYGGEEFVVILPDTSLTGAMQLAEDYRQAAMQTRYEDEHLTISIGVAEYQQQAVEAFFDTADRALLEAKRRGRNQICDEPAAQPG